jgi:translocation and assembly module TamB
MDIRWKGALQNAEVETAFDVLPPLHVPSNQLPVTATGRATYRGLPGELEVKEFSLGTRGSQMHASGTLSKSAALKFSVNTTDLNEWQALISVLRGPTSIPVSLNGRAVLIATATGKTSDPVINGTLEADDFDLNVPATAHTEQKDIHWDSISTDLQVSQHNFAARRGHLLHDQTDIRFDVQAQLRDGDFTPDSGFTTHLNVHHMDVSEMLAIAGQNYPVQGLISFVAQGSGTRSDPHFDGQMRLSQGSAYGQPISQLNTNVSADSEHIEVVGLQLAQGKAEVSGSGSYNWDAQSFSTDLKGSSFDLANFHQLHGLPINMTGHLDFRVQGSGTVQAPDLNATVHLRDLAVDQEHEGDFTLQAVTKGGAIELNGRSQFEHSDLAVQGTVRYGGDWPADLQLVLNQLDVDPFLKLYLHDGVTGHSNVAGNIRVVGPLRQWRQLNVDANLSSFSANIEHVAVHNDGQLQFALANGTLNLQHLRLVGEGTDLTATGTAQLEGDQSLALQAQGHLNLHLIETINSDFTAAGSVAVDASLGGTLHEPLLHGQLQITKGSIAYIDLPSALSDIEGTVVFNQNRAEIQQLSAHVGGGLINLTGSASTYKGQFSFDLGAQAHEVRLRYPAGVSSTADLNLRFAGTSSESLFSGDITITKLALTPGVDFASYLGSASANASLPQTDRLLNRIRMDVHITTLPELQMQTAVVRLSGDADLHLRGTVAKPVLLGRVDVIEGQVSFNGTDYRLERGYIRFTNPVSTTPILDLQASTRVRDYDITLNVNGEADKPNITYRSEPPLATTDIIGLLAFGQTAEQSAQLQQSGQSPLAQVAGGAILSEALNSTVGNRVQRLFGVSRIKIDPQGLSTTTTPTQTGPAVTIEQQVKNDLTLTYSTSISEASQQIIQAEYNLTRNISIVGLRDQNGVVSFVVKFRKRKN